MEYRFGAPLKAVLATTALVAVVSVGRSDGIQRLQTELVIENVRIFDGQRILAERAVAVRNGLIVDIAAQIPRSPDATVIDGTGQTLLPGFIDSHVHAGTSRTGPRDAESGAEALKQALIFGVTTVLDMFHPVPDVIKRLKQEQSDANNSDRADLLSAGICATVPGGHGTQFGFTIPTISRPEEAAAFVDARLAEGSDYIKIIYGPQWRPMLQRETMAALVRSTHDRHALAVAHVTDVERAREAVEAGIDGLVHAPDVGEADLDLGRTTARTGASLTPTLAVVETLNGTAGGTSLTTDARLAGFLTPDAIKNLTEPMGAKPQPGRSYADAEKVVRVLNDAGVRILAGSDAPNAGTAHGVSMHRELELLVRAGLAPTAAIAAATSAPAQQFRLADRGRIATGTRADLLLVRGDPTADILATRSIVGVWKGGVRLDRERYRTNLSQR